MRIAWILKFRVSSLFVLGRYSPTSDMLDSLPNYILRKLEIPSGANYLSSWVIRLGTKQFRPTLVDLDRTRRAAVATGVVVVVVTRQLRR